MLFDQNPELRDPNKRPRTLVVSVLAHIVLLAIIAFNPDWFETSHRRIIRIAGEDFDLNRIEIQPLILPPMPRAQAAPPPAPAPPWALPAHRLPPGRPCVHPRVTGCAAAGVRRAPCVRARCASGESGGYGGCAGRSTVGVSRQQENRGAAARCSGARPAGRLGPST